MSEFKGSKGKWRVIKNSTTLSCNKEQIITCWFFTNRKEEAKANALLISKAPEMLEMLKEIVHAFDSDNLHGYQEEILKQTKQLIKEATEI